MQDDMERRRYHSDPATGEFLLLEWDNSHKGWMPAMPTMQAWQVGAASIYRPGNLPDTLVTMPNHTYWRRLGKSEETDIIVLLERPWIQNSYAEEIPQDDQIDQIDAVAAVMSETHRSTSASYPNGSASYPKHIIDAVLDNAEATKKLCPITMEPIQKATAAITSCGHIFQKAALTEWLKTNNTCPECRAIP